MTNHKIRGSVQRFPGKNGWHYLALNKQLCDALGSRVRSAWPALIKAQCTIGQTSWTASVMPIKDGSLFVALPVNVRKAERIDVGDTVVMVLHL